MKSPAKAGLSCNSCDKLLPDVLEHLLALFGVVLGFGFVMR